MNGPDRELAELLRDYGQGYEITRVGRGALVAVRRPRVPSAGSITADDAEALRRKLDAAGTEAPARLAHVSECITHGLGHQGFILGPHGFDSRLAQLLAAVSDGPAAWAHVSLNDRWYTVYVIDAE